MDAEQEKAGEVSDLQQSESQDARARNKRVKIL